MAASYSHNKFVAVCYVEIEPEFLKSILMVARGELVVATKKDALFAEMLTSQSDDRAFQSIETHLEFQGIGNHFVDFMNRLSERAGFWNTPIVILDGITVKSGDYAYVVMKTSEPQITDRTYLGFRCDISSLVTALNTLVTSGLSANNVISMRNEAAMAGGVWKKDVVGEMMRRRAKAFDLKHFPQHQNWTNEDDVGYARGRDFPVFRTAPISMKTLERLLTTTYDRFSGHQPPYLAFITQLTPPYTDGPAGAPLQRVPSLSDEILHARPSDFDAVVRSCFVDEEFHLNPNRYIVMDEFSEVDDTVLIATNEEANGQLVVARCTFADAMPALFAPGNEVVTVEDQAEQPTRPTRMARNICW